MAEARFTAPARLDAKTGETLYGEVRGKRLKRGDVATVDLSQTGHVDPKGAAWLLAASDLLRKRRAELRLEGASDDGYLNLIRPAFEIEPPAPPRRTGAVEQIGGATLSAFGEVKEIGALCVDALFWTVLAPFEGKGFRWENFFDEIYEMGVRAIGIVCLMNFLLGLIIAMLMAKQAELYGMQLFVADLVMIGFSRELAAIMTAVVVSARTGAAIAAELATMKVQEEIDALRGMGVNVVQYLVSPKLLALLIVLPCLVALGMISGIAGGALWGLVVLNFTSEIWITQTINAAYFSDFVQGMSKTIIFAIFIVLIGCHNGLRVRGGSRGVGLMTTRAVVMDIFMLICVDIVFAAVFYYLLP